MVSEVAGRRGAGVRLMLALASLPLAGGLLASAWPDPRRVVLSSIALLGALGWAWVEARRGCGAGEVSSARRDFAADDDTLSRRLALLDSQLELAPVALWWLRDGEAAPLNAQARRLIAPGGAQDREALLRHLARWAAPAVGTPPGPQLVSIAAERGDERWLLRGIELQVAGEAASLLAMMPVESQLEAETLHAWRQLVHVLTHEIMNSLTPIASLSEQALEMVTQARVDDGGAGDRPDDRQDLMLALEAVARRSTSLAAFVASYRRITDWPAPRPAPVQLEALFGRLEMLVAAGWRARGGEATFDVQPPSLDLMADAGHLEQALLNLIRNAEQATAELAAPRLKIQARLSRGGRLLISVRDNGPGVASGLEKDIFLPFFSTQARAEAGPTPARGIGLAVVRNLVHGMGGQVRSVRTPDGGACFVLSF